MTDIALVWNAETWAADLLLAGGQLVTDDGLRTAVLISLFSDARAPADAELPEGGDDRRGWWGDAFPPAAPGAFGSGPKSGGALPLGSLLWLLRRAKITAAVVEQARQAAEAALDWLLRDGVASAVSVAAEAQGSRLAIGVTLERPQGPGRQRWDFTWDASTGELAA